MSIGYLFEVGVGLVLLASVVVSVLKSRILSAIIGVVGVVAIAAGWTVGGWYVFNLLVWIPAWTAIRLARPDSWWSNRYYSKNPSKFVRAVIRYGLVKEYIENRRKALTPEEFKTCLVNLTVMALTSRAATEYVRAAINEASDNED
ncbi:MAG: hypothetical protein P4L99_04525 [Chthoniobacter sp.]|nr:hypothetical protein [Chthoniobacter sp.]